MRRAFQTNKVSNFLFRASFLRKLPEDVIQQNEGIQQKNKQTNKQTNQQKTRRACNLGNMPSGFSGGR